jgi:outer membrane protein
MAVVGFGKGSLCVAAVAASLALTASGASAQADTAKAQPDTTAQTTQLATLTLQDAIALARQNNPGYLAQRNNSSEADWRVREAFARFLPQASIGGGLQYQAPGSPLLGLFTSQDLGIARTPPYYFSDYGLNLDWSLDANTIFGPSQALANRRAVSARIDAASFSLVTAVTSRYLAVLRAEDGLDLARKQLARLQGNEQLAVTRVQSGAAAPLDSLQAQVDAGRGRVTLLQAESALREARLRLAQELGVTLGSDVSLTSTFQVFEPGWTDAQLEDWARSGNPMLHALQADAASAQASLRAARGAYLPSLQVSAGWSGYTRQQGDANQLISQAQSQVQGEQQSCELMNEISAGLSQPLPGYPQDCAQYVLTPTQQQTILDRNNVFPFHFTASPPIVQLRVSLPIFQGFTRQRQVATARAAADDAGYQERATALQLRADVAAAADSLRTIYQTVQIETQNQQLATVQLELARQRYALGAGTFLELQQAEATKSDADRSRLDALYGFHQALVNLESIVGRSLRTGGAS